MFRSARDDSIDTFFEYPSPAGGEVLKHTLSSNADNGADKGNSSSEENPSVHRST
ncbi:MAG: hypothetical protein MSS98_07685 [Alphaproteobacteria bacterium]|nr:hypothetical protein [Alphaproteobacteria bacterium]MDY4689216.1 hypothetical protein [Alphaproteobacteria bacterium]